MDIQGLQRRGVPEYLHAPIDLGSPSGPPQDVCPSARTLSPCLLCPLPLPPWPVLPRESVGDSHSLWPAFHCSPGTCDTKPRQRRVPATATRCGGTRVSTSCGAPRRTLAAGARPRGASVARPTTTGGSPSLLTLPAAVPAPRRGEVTVASLLASLGPSCSLCRREPLSESG